MDPKTILIVEDDAAIRAGFGLILKRRGYQVALARTGQDGLEYLQTHDPPDVIILDMFMPAMDGWRFLKYRDARWSDVPVLVTTALPVASEEWAQSLGACGCIQKPIGSEDLVERVRACFATASRQSKKNPA